MSITVSCSACGRVKTAPDEFAGKRVKCACGTTFHVPIPSMAAAVSSAAPVRVPLDLAPAQPYIPPQPVSQPAGPPTEQTLLEARPSAFRNRPVMYVLVVVLMVFFALLGVVMLFATIATADGSAKAVFVPMLFFGLLGLQIARWHLESMTTLLIVTNMRTKLRRGIFSKHTREVRHSDVRSLDLSQGMFQRMMGVGEIAVSSSGQGEREIVVGGLPNPEHIKNTIDCYRR